MRVSLVGTFGDTRRVLAGGGRSVGEARPTATRVWAALSASFHGWGDLVCQPGQAGSDLAECSEELLAFGLGQLSHGLGDGPVNGWQVLIDGSLSLDGEVKKELAAVSGVATPFHQTATLERVE